MGFRSYLGKRKESTIHIDIIIKQLINCIYENYKNNYPPPIQSKRINKKESSQSQLTN